jgi:hypothetical protein
LIPIVREVTLADIDKMMNTQQVVIGLKRGDFGDVATERRSEERRPCEPTPVRIVLEGDPAGIEALIVNVSKSGIGMRIDRRLIAGTKATVETNSLIIAGTIRYCVNNRDAGWFDLGFKIDQVS